MDLVRFWFGSGSCKALTSRSLKKKIGSFLSRESQRAEIAGEGYGGDETVSQSDSWETRN